MDDEITLMAKQAHHELVTLDYVGHMGGLEPWTMRLLERFYNLVVAKEREVIRKQIATLHDSLSMASNTQVVNEPVFEDEEDDVADMFNAYKAYKKERRQRLGMPCPNCMIRLPKSHPKILLPNQTCWCGYTDKRQRGE